MTNRRRRIRTLSDSELVDLVVMGLVTPNADKAHSVTALWEADRAVKELRRRHPESRCHGPRCVCFDCFVGYAACDDQGIEAGPFD